MITLMCKVSGDRKLSFGEHNGWKKKKKKKRIPQSEEPYCVVFFFFFEHLLLWDCYEFVQCMTVWLRFFIYYF